MGVATMESMIVIPEPPLSTLDTKRWWKHPNLRALNFWLLVPLSSIFSIGFDGAMMTGLQAVTHWREFFGTPEGATLGIFNAAMPLGGILASFLIAPVSDRYGRRYGLALGALISIIGAALQAASVNLPMFIVSRLIVGAGGVIVSGAGGPWITEIAHPAHRATATALFLTFWGLGSITAAWLTFGTFRIEGDASWRIPSAMQAAPNVLQLMFIYGVPESPRWLVSKGHNEEALAMLAKYHGEGDADEPVVVFEYKEITATLEAERQAAPVTMLGTARELISTRGNRKRLFILVWAAICFQMSGSAFVAYYLPPILQSVGLDTDLEMTLINATSQILSWLSAIYFATLPGKIGRRTMFLCSLVAMWLVLVGITAGSAVFDRDMTNPAGGGPNLPAGYAVVVCLYLFFPAYNFGFGGNLGLYITEIMPYRIRTTGMAVFYFVLQLMLILSIFAVGIGLQTIQWRLYIFFLCWIPVELIVVYFVFPETKGPSLEDIAHIFDGRRPATDAETGSETDRQLIEEKRIV